MATESKCTKCKEVKDVSEFSLDKHAKSGFAVYCKACRSAIYHGKKDRILPQYREYREQNKERLKFQRKEWDRLRFFYKRAANLVTRRSPEERSLVLKSIPERCSEISLLWKKQKGICPLSGRRLNRDNVHLDHIVAVRQGGSDDVSNLRWLHKEVNYAKRTLSDEQLLLLCSDVFNAMSSKLKV